MVLSGEIESIGKHVTRFKPGDKVYGMTGLKFGSYSEYNCMPEASCLVKKPDNISHEEAAAITYGAILAGHFLKKAIIKPDEKVLIYGASGAIGTTAVQLAKHYGADVTGVCSTINLEMVRALGADTVIDYTKEDLLSKKERYDFIFDAVGKKKSSTLKSQCKKVLSKNGKYFSVDRGSPKNLPEYLEHINELINAGEFKAVIDRCYPLEQIVEAHRYTDTGHKKGNVIITIEGKS